MDYSGVGAHLWTNLYNHRDRMGYWTLIWGCDADTHMGVTPPGCLYLGWEELVFLGKMKALLTKKGGGHSQAKARVTLYTSLLLMGLVYTPHFPNQDTRNKITAPGYGWPNLLGYLNHYPIPKGKHDWRLYLWVSIFHAILFDSKNVLYSFKLDSYDSNFLLDDYIYSFYTTVR